MRLDLNRRVTVTLAALALCVAIVVPAVAFASDPGTTFEDPYVLSSTIPWSQDVTGTLVSYKWDDGTTDYDLFYKIHLTKGQTVSMEGSTTVLGSDLGVYVRPLSFESDFGQWVDWTSDTRCHLTFMAPKDGDYMINPTSSAAVDWAMNMSPATAPKYSVSGVTLSTSKPKKSKSFTVTEKLGGEYDGFFSPVTFVVKIWKGGKYSSPKTYKSKISDGSPSWTKFSASLKLSKGKYEVQAIFSDAVHSKQTTKFKTFSVK